MIPKECKSLAGGQTLNVDMEEGKDWESPIEFSGYREHTNQACSTFVNLRLGYALVEIVSPEEVMGYEES